MENSTAQKSGNTIFQRVTQMLRREKPVEAPVLAPEPVAPAETEEKRLARLEAYRQFCEAEAQKGEDKSEKKGFKYRAPDFNA